MKKPIFLRKSNNDASLFDVSVVENNRIKIVQIEKGEEIGRIEATPLFEADKQGYSIQTFKVHQDFWKKENGRKLMNKLIEELNKINIKNIFVNPGPDSYPAEKTLTLDALIKIYEHLGFEKNHNSNLANEMVLNLKN